jgi:hypothetical protein
MRLSWFSSQMTAIWFNHFLRCAEFSRGIVPFSLPDHERRPEGAGRITELPDDHLHGGDGQRKRVRARISRAIGSDTYGLLAATHKVTQQGIVSFAGSEVRTKSTSVSPGKVS